MIGKRDRDKLGMIPKVSAHVEVGLNVLVLSDTHMPARARELPVPVKEAVAKADLILHAGDLASEAVLADLENHAPVVAVYGNVDVDELRKRLPRRVIVPIRQYRIGLIHGDGSWSSTMARAAAAFANESVDCVVFGHSHQPICERRLGVLFLNPGSPTDKRRQPKHSFAWLRPGTTLEAELVYF